MPEKPNQLIDPEVQPHDNVSYENGVGVSLPPLSVPYQPQQPPYGQLPSSQPQWSQRSSQQWQQPMPPQQQWQSQPQMYWSQMPPTPLRSARRGFKSTAITLEALTICSWLLGTILAVATRSGAVFGVSLLLGLILTIVGLIFVCLI